MRLSAHRDAKVTRLTKQGFVARGAAAMPVAGGFALAIRLRFHNHAPHQLATFLAIHQQAADELGGDDFGGGAKKAWGSAGRAWWLREWLGWGG